MFLGNWNHRFLRASVKYPKKNIRWQRVLNPLLVGPLLVRSCILVPYSLAIFKTFFSHLFLVQKNGTLVWCRKLEPCSGAIARTLFWRKKQEPQNSDSIART